MQVVEIRVQMEVPEQVQHLVHMQQLRREQEAVQGQLGRQLLLVRLQQLVKLCGFLDQRLVKLSLRVGLVVFLELEAVWGMVAVVAAVYLVAALVLEEVGLLLVMVALPMEQEVMEEIARHH